MHQLENIRRCYLSHFSKLLCIFLLIVYIIALSCAYRMSNLSVIFKGYAFFCFKVNSKFLYFYVGKGREEAVSFKQVLAGFPNDCTAAGTVNDISPHLCFICLLHLANEHGLSIHGCANLDDLSIRFPHNGTCTSQ
jgi:hypothetical protein